MMFGRAGGGGEQPSSAAAAAEAHHRRCRGSFSPRLLPLLLVLSAAAPLLAAAEDWGQVQYTGLVDAYYDGQVLVASAGSLVAPTSELRRRAAAAAARASGSKSKSSRPAWPPFQSGEECRQACAALAGCNAFRFCARQDGCALADCGRWFDDLGGQQQKRLPAPGGGDASFSSFNATAAGLLQLPVKALGPFGGDAWRCVEPGKESAAAGWRAAAGQAYGGAGGSPSGRRRRRSLLDGGGGDGGGAGKSNNNNGSNKPSTPKPPPQQGPPRWPYGTCTLLLVGDPSKPPALKAGGTGWGGGWRSGTVLLPEACLEKRTGQALPPSADACRACLSAAARDGKAGGGPSPDVCASCAATPSATGEERSSSSSSSGGGGGGSWVDGRRAPVFAAVHGAALAAAKGDGAATTLLGSQAGCVSFCAAAGSGAERDAAWRCPGCVLSGSPCAKCFSDRARRAALSAAFGGGSGPLSQQASASPSSPARYDAGACVSCVQEVAKGGGRGAERLLFGGCVACSAHANNGGGNNGGSSNNNNGRCARCVASAAAQRPWWWPAASRSRDRTPCDVCDASAAPGDDATFDACVGCFKDPLYRGGPDCLRCALLQDAGSVRRCYACVSRARMSGPELRGCSDCLDYYTPEKERERCLSCVEDPRVAGAAKAVCSMCTADSVINPGRPGASDERRPAVGDKGRCLECLGRGVSSAANRLEDWRARCVAPASGG